jgi:hypothetical protein
LITSNNGFNFYLTSLHNTLPSPQALVAKNSIISQIIAHSSTIQNGENWANPADCIIRTSWSYANNARTKFIQAHRNIHLNQKGNFQLGKAGCLSIIPNNQNIHQMVVYHSNIANLSIKLTSVTSIGNTKKAINQIRNPRVFAVAILLAKLDLNLNIHIKKWLDIK